MEPEVCPAAHIIAQGFAFEGGTNCARARLAGNKAERASVI